MTKSLLTIALFINNKGGFLMKDKKRPINREDLLKLTIPSDPQITPDGSAYMFTSTHINANREYESHLYFQSLNEPLPIKWTQCKGNNSHPRFSPDGKSFVFQSNRSGTMQIYMTSMKGGEPEKLTNFTYGAKEPHWSPDGMHIIFSASLYADDSLEKQREMSKEEKSNEKETLNKKPTIVRHLKYKSDAHGLFDQKRTHLIAYHVLDKTFKRLTKEHIDHTFESVSPDGKFVLFSANYNEDADFEQTNDLFTLCLDTLKITKITNEKGTYGQASFSPCGKYIACFGNQLEYLGATLTHLYLINLDQNKLTCLSSSWDLQLDDAMINDIQTGYQPTGPTWNDSSDEIYFITTKDGYTSLEACNLNGVLKTLYSNNNHVFSFAVHPKQQHSFVIGVSAPTHPADFYLLEDNECKQLTTMNKKLLNELALSEPEEMIIPSSDGLQVQGWLLKPYDFQADKKYPLILEIHGGPHAMYGQTFFHEMQLLAAEGYAVLYTNPRGSHGYGQKYVGAVLNDYGRGDYEDLMHAVDHALESYPFIDSDRLGVTGGSYGGFMTNWIIGKTSRFKAAVTQRSISNWLSMYGVSDIGYFFTKWELGYTLPESPEKLWDYSPLKYVKEIETPLLILHGEEDLRCPIEQAEQLFTTLKQLRKKVEFVRFPHANHELSRSGDPTLRLERLHHICRWFEQYV